MRVVFVVSSRSDFGLIRPVLKFFSGVAQQDVDLLCLDTSGTLHDDHLLDDVGKVRVHRPFKGDMHARHMQTPLEVITLFSELCAAIADWIATVKSEVKWMIIPGDRFEIMAATVAAYYSNIPIAHLFGGDRSQGGHLDDNVRHAISKLAHIHFPVCDNSAKRLLKMGEESWRVFNVGSPVVESILEITAEDKIDINRWIPPKKYNLICTYHPITTESWGAGEQFRSIVDAILMVSEQEDVSCLFTHPNNEVGSASILAELERIKHHPNFRIYESLGWKNYLSVLRCCDLMIGNSSSAMLEAPIMGVAALDIGSRQRGRYCPSSVYHEEAYDAKAISGKILEILKAGKSGKASHPYGDGSTSRLIFENLTRITRDYSLKAILQKKITY